jgi:hypothetical protein
MQKFNAESFFPILLVAEMSACFQMFMAGNTASGPTDSVVEVIRMSDPDQEVEGGPPNGLPLNAAFTDPDRWAHDYNLADLSEVMFAAVKGIWEAGNSGVGGPDDEASTVTAICAAWSVMVKQAHVRSHGSTCEVELR